MHFDSAYPLARIFTSLPLRRDRRAIRGRYGARSVVAFEHHGGCGSAEEKRKEKNESRQWESERRSPIILVVGYGPWNRWVSRHGDGKNVFSQKLFPGVSCPRALSFHPSSVPGRTPFPPLRRPRAKKVSANLTLAVPFIRPDKSSQRRSAAAVEEKIFTAIGSAERRCVR